MVVGVDDSLLVAGAGVDRGLVVIVVGVDGDPEDLHLRLAAIGVDVDAGHVDIGLVAAGRFIRGDIHQAPTAAALDQPLQRGLQRGQRRLGGLAGGQDHAGEGDAFILGALILAGLAIGGRRGAGQLPLGLGAVQLVHDRDRAAGMEAAAVMDANQGVAGAERQGRRRNTAQRQDLKFHRQPFANSTGQTSLLMHRRSSEIAVTRRGAEIGRVDMDFQAALELGDINAIRQIPKADLHNHFIGGGDRDYIFERTGRRIAPLERKLVSMADMHAWFDRATEGMFTDREGRLIAFQAALTQARRDGVTRIENGEDVWAITLNDFSAGTLVANLEAAHQRIAPDIDWIAQLGFSRHCPIFAIERWLQPFLDLGYGQSVDLSGDEFAQPIEAFVPVYARVKAAGLRLKAHVGEWGTADDVWRAAKALADEHHVKCGGHRLNAGKDARQDQALEHRLAVDQYFSAVDGDFSQAEIAIEFIDLIFAAVESELQVIQERNAGFPEFLILEIKHQSVEPRASATV